MKNNIKNFQVLGAKVSLVPSLIGWFLALTLGLFAVMAQAEEFRYRYVSLDDKAPPGFAGFAPGAINNGGQVAGYVFNCDDVSCFDFHVAIYKDGAVTVLQPGTGGSINAGGTIGGTVVLDPDPFNFIEQAALFRSDQVELIPPQPGEFTSFVTALNDSNMALVTSFDTSFTETNVLYNKGQATVLGFGRPSDLNNQGLIAGTTGDAFSNARGFRFDPRTGEAELLNPVSPDTLAWGLGINNRGDVLGYSFVLGGASYHERIGVWDRKGNFKTYFVEGRGIPEFPTISNRLLFNDNNLIVITFVSSPASERFKNSYLVPKPGVRLNLSDLVENLPLGLNPSYILDINNHGDMIGFDFFGGGTFLLERVGATGLASSMVPTPSPGVENGRRPIPPAAAAMLRRHILQLKSGSALSQDPLENLLLK